MASLRKSTNRRAALHGKAFLSDRDCQSETTEDVTSTDDDGGVRLDALNLEDSPINNVRIGQKSPGVVKTSDSSPDGGAPLFQVGKIAGDEDVFLSPGKSGQTSGKGVQNEHSAEEAKITQSPDVQFGFTPSKKASQQSLNSPGLVDTPQRSLRTRASDLSARHQVGGIDAQAFYPPTACVFVANLPENVKDSKLEAEVTRVFARFGTVFVKIRRDHKNMPFAFCQYTTNEDARMAMGGGRGTVIQGRAVRTEMVKANRAFIMFHNHGGPLDVDEARKALAQFGPMSKCEPLDAQMQEALGLGPAVHVEFTTFDPNRDIQAFFRHHVSYRVMTYDPKKAFQSPKVDSDEVWLQRYEVDRRSVFIGNLPTEMDDLEEKIKAISDEIGDVISVQVIRKEGKNGRPVVFSFVEFARVDMADMAVARLTGETLLGSNIRVERKSGHNSTTPLGPRRSRSTLLLADAYQSPSRGAQVMKRQPANYSPSAKMVPENMYNMPQAVAESSPLTPLKNVSGSLAQPGSARSTSSATLGGVAPPPYWMSGTGHYGSPNYTTSPYGNHPPAVGFYGSQHLPAGAPQSMFPGIGAPPPTGVIAPGYAQYYPAHYNNWGPSFMTDQNMAPMGYYSSPTQLDGSAARPDESIPETPTKQASAGHGDAASGQGGKQGDTPAAS